MRSLFAAARLAAEHALSDRAEHRSAVGERATLLGQIVLLCRVPFKVTMLLADSAQVSDAKLYVIGGGWKPRGYCNLCHTLS